MAGTVALVAGAIFAPRLLEGPQDFGFQALLGRRAQAVRAQVYDDQVVYLTPMGEFTLSRSCQNLGTGFAERWTKDGRVLVQDAPQSTPRSSTRGYLNDPDYGGVNAFGWYWGTGTPPFRSWDLDWIDPVLAPNQAPTFPWWSWSGNRKCRWPGVVWVTNTRVTRTTFEQSICLLKGCLVEARVGWEFFAARVVYGATVTVRPFPADQYLKEPEFAFRFSGPVDRIVTPGTTCPDYFGLTNPRVRTGRCSQPGRRRVLLARAGQDVLLTVDDQDWRRLAADARSWPRAGPNGCVGLSASGWGVHTEPYSSWEYVAQAPSVEAPYDDTIILLKAWEGGVTGGGDDPGACYAFYRSPRGTHTYRFSVSFTLGS